MAYAMKPVAYQDAGEIADAMMRAMYDDEHYAILLSNVSLEELIEDTAKRVPYNLSTQRGFLRHEKVIHEQTGEIVGYARWELPEHLAGNTIWPEAQMPKPTDEESKIFQQNFQSTFEHGMRRTMNREMGDYIGPVLGRNLAELIKAGPYLGDIYPASRTLYVLDTKIFNSPGLSNHCSNSSKKRNCVFTCGERSSTS